MKQKTKISVIGAGNVGSTTAYTLMLSDLSLEIALIDIDEKKARGDALDIMHGSAFLPSSEIYAGSYTDCGDSEIIIITAGAKQKPGETRIDLLKRNHTIFKSIVKEISANCKHQPIIIPVSNPVDILTYLTYELTGFDRKKIIGSGTVLDSSRFKYILGKTIGVDPKSIHAYIIGEHGDSEVPAWSRTSIAGMKFDEYKNFDQTAKEEIFESIKNAAYEVIELKGATYYAIALSVRRIVESILRDDNALLPVSCVLTGEYGISGVALSLPAIVGKDGIDKIFPVEFNHKELQDLKKSAEILQKNYSSLK